MAQKKKSSVSKILSILIGVPALFNLVRKIVTLIGLEARLAGRSLISIIILSVMFSIVFTTAWLCLLAMFFVYLTSVTLSTEVSLLVIFLLNILLLFIIALLISQFKKKLLFQRTRKQIKYARDPYDLG